VEQAGAAHPVEVGRLHVQSVEPVDPQGVALTADRSAAGVPSDAVPPVGEHHHHRLATA
jgi:hypothetical protein